MKKSLVVFFCCLQLPMLCYAKDFEFAQDADMMVDQLLGEDKVFGESRGFVIEKTRSIKLQRMNEIGTIETVQLDVPENSINTGAKLKIEFDVNSSNLRASSYSLLQELHKALDDERISGQQICIKGHTDSDGSESYNMQLSYQRAYSVMNYLRGGAGIEAKRLYVFGYGEHLPIMPNTSRYNKQVNRRVEVSLNCPESAM